ncbi:nuclear factor 7, ovary-like [Salvelinus sp. IW2-2015]|uniref:nuclear factor 7, ovary-like n=1 Tax=Salvelinus sp. IW2-2015 TaxID=2691554 RepID=UPI0038D4F203
MSGQAAFLSDDGSSGSCLADGSSGSGQTGGSEGSGQMGGLKVQDRRAALKAQDRRAVLKAQDRGGFEVNATQLAPEWLHLPLPDRPPLCAICTEIFTDLCSSAASTPSVREERCPEHGETMKLFCVTDRKLICLVCKKGDPQLSKEKIRTQFEEVINKLKQREEQAMRELDRRDGLVNIKMEKHLTKIKRHETDVKKRETSLQSGLDITDPTKFLQWWTEKGRATCDTRQVCPAIYKAPRVERPTQSEGYEDPETLLGFIGWEGIEKSLEWKLYQLERSDERCVLS